MLHIYSAIFIFGALLIHPELATLHCSHQINDGVQRCVQPVAQYARVLNQKESQNSSNAVKNNFGQAITLPKIGRYVFRELCRLVRQFNECVYELRHQCPKHVTVTLIDASYGFLCNEGYETFMSSAECLMELDGQPTVKKCHETTLEHIEAANKQLGITRPTRFDKMCQALIYFSSCVEQPITHSCGAAAWEVIYRVLRDTTNTLLPGCQFTAHSMSLDLSLPLSHRFSETAVMTTTANRHEKHDKILNDKAKIIWSNEDVTTRQVTVVDVNAGKKFTDDLRPAHDADPRKNTLNSQGQMSGHVFIDRNTDVSYYDVETASSNSFSPLVRLSFLILSICLYSIYHLVI